MSTAFQGATSFVFNNRCHHERKGVHGKPAAAL